MSTPNAYAEVSVVVNGALEEEETFYDETLLREYVSTIEEDAAGHGYLTQVYVLYHEHEPGPCECIQYETDHSPAYTFNGGEE